MKKSDIELSRLGNLLIYFADNTSNCGYVKAMKLLYYLDCYHLLEYGRKVLNYRYKKFPQGPVPTEVLEMLNAITEYEEYDGFRYTLSDYIDVKPENITDELVLRKIVSKKRFEPRWFSESERNILKKVTGEFKNFSAKELSNKTHNEKPWKEAEPLEEIDLKLYLSDKLPLEQVEEIAYIEKEIEAMNCNYK